MHRLEQELATHAQALRALARLLVGDRDADDLVQETSLQVLAAPPPRPTALRGFLQVVLGRLASKRRRGEARRRRRELSAPPPEPLPSPAAAAAHKETLQRLTAALTALPEPYLQTLLLRFFEDLKPAAIASRTHVPLATVKSRLQRGLALLRERLDVDGRSDWRLGLGAMFDLELVATAASAAAAPVLGTALMSTTARLTIAAAAILLAGTTWILLGMERAAQQPQPAASAAPATPSTAVADAGTGARGAADGRRDAVAAADRLPAPVQPTLRGRCLDDAAQPLAGLAIALRRHRDPTTGEFDAAPAYAQWLAAHPGSEWQDLQATTGADGTFGFAFAAPPLALSLHAEHDGLEHYLLVGQLPAGTARDLGELVLPMTCRVQGRIVDGSGGAVGAAEVSVRERATASLSVALLAEAQGRRLLYPIAARQGHTAADGSFELRLLPGDYDLLVLHRRIERGARLLVPLRTPMLEHAVTVEAVGANGELGGVVVDGRGRPVAGAEVAAGSRRDGVAHSDRHGRFSLLRLDSKDPSVIVMARLGNRGPASAKGRWGQRDLRIVLPDAVTCTIELRVRGPDGAPVTDYRVRGHGSQHEYGWHRFDGHHDDGLVLLADVPARVRWLTVASDRSDLGDGGFVPLPKERQGRLHLDVVLPAAGERRLRVVRADGSAAAGIAVELLDARLRLPQLGDRALARDRPLQPELLQRPGSALQLQAGTTDANGELLLRGPCGVPLAVRLPGGGNPPLLLPCTLEVPRPLVVTLPPNGRVVGRIEPAAAVQQLRAGCGLPAAGDGQVAAASAHQGIRLRRSRDGIVDYVPSLHTGGAVPAGDGAFAIDGVPPGTWDVIVPMGDAITAPDEAATLAAAGSVTVRADAANAIMLQLGDRLLATLAAQVLGNGVPLARRMLFVHHGDRSRQREALVQTDAAGCFSLQTRAGTVYVSTVDDGGSGMRSDCLWAREAVLLEPGAKVAAVLHIDSAKVRLRLGDAKGRPAADAWTILRGADGVLHTPPCSDVDGVLEAEVEPGAWTVLVLPRELGRNRGPTLAWRAQHSQSLADPFFTSHSQDGSLLPAGEVTAKVGELVEVPLQLPAAWNR